MQNSIVKVSKCFNIFYTIFTQVLDKIENFEFPRNAQCLLSASLKKTISESKARFQSLRDEIDRAERSWIKEMNQVKFNDMFHMNGMKSELDRKIRITTDTIASCRNALEHSHHLELLSYLSENIDPACLQSLKITLPSLVHFQPSQYKLPIVTELIGRTRQEENKTLQTPKQLKRTGKFIATRKFELGMIRVEQIKTIANKRADTLRHTNTGMWVNSGSNMSLKLYDENINEMKQKNSVKLNFHITDMALDSLENIIATDARNKRVIRIDLLGEFNTVCSTAPLVPRGVCINNWQQIVVGVGTSDGKPPVELLVYSTDLKKIEKEIETVGSGNPLFTGGIFQVKQMEKGDYVISHFRSIVCLSLEGIHRWEYRLQCICYGLVCDQYDNIIAADHMDHTVHLLNCDGMLIKTLLTREDGIYYPYCLSIDKHGYLWIGQDKNLKVIQYLKWKGLDVSICQSRNILKSCS